MILDKLRQHTTFTQEVRTREESMEARGSAGGGDGHADGGRMEEEEEEGAASGTSFRADRGVTVRLLEEPLNVCFVLTSGRHVSATTGD